MSDWPMTREDADANGLCRHKMDWREHCDGCEGDLRADNDRLRALVKAGERGTNAYPICPWCEWDGGGHRADCPAFTPEGLVK